MDKPCDYHPRESMRHPYLWLQWSAFVLAVLCFLTYSWLSLLGIPLIVYFILAPRLIFGVWVGECPVCSSELKLAPAQDIVHCERCHSHIFRHNRRLFH